LSGKEFARLVDLGHLQARAITLSLGGQEVELVDFAQPGRPYPAERASNDPWFQHMAIAVADMRIAHARLSASRGWSVITFPEPQRLPASSGGVVAFKFRDPEGHPLELLEFPPGNTPPAWRPRDGASSSLGIDHSAIVVSDTERSIDFYRLLGFAVGHRSLNYGIEQARLDGLADPVVEVTALDLAATGAPHLEMLRYRSPEHRVSTKWQSNDVAAARLVLQIDDLPMLTSRMTAAGIVLSSRGNAALMNDATAALVRDPDGHALVLMR
jgi:catechol 2,3-dioxygenase-like lactoylglutathione lyase family enzyme